MKKSLFLLMSPLLTATMFASGITFIPDFSGLTPGTNSPLSITEGGITATFYSNNDPVTGSAFSVGPTFFYSLNGNVVLDSGMQFNTLNIVFSQTINELEFTFAVDDGNYSNNASPTLTATGFSGGFSGTQEATSTVAATIPTPPGGGYTFPEGLMDLQSATGFDSVTVTSNVGDFALGWDLSGNSGLPPAGAGDSAPEPGSVLLAVAGIGALWAGKRRKKSLQA